MDDGDGPPAPAPPPQDGPLPVPANRTATFAWVAVLVILVGVIALVVYALTDTTPAQSVAHPAPTATDVVGQLSAVPSATFDDVGGSTTPSVSMTPPTLLTGQPPLTSAGKPEILFVGADFCPFCAAERWPLIVALSRFGRFRHLANMQSTPQSVFPGIQTFTFTGTTYTSPYVALTAVELYSDTPGANGVFTRIDTLDPAQQALVGKYRGTATGALPGSYPFVDIANRAVTSTAAFSPTLLLHLSQATVAGDLAQAQNPAGQAVVAAANQLTAAICLATRQRPGRVCASKGVRDAAATLTR